MDLSMIRGDDGTFELSLFSSDGDPLDLTDATDITFTVGYDPLFSKALGSGVAIGDVESGSGSDPLDGIIEVTVDAADTEGLPAFPRSYDYAVRVTWADGTVATKAKGRFHIIPTPVPA